MADCSSLEQLFIDKIEQLDWNIIEHIFDYEK